jgi:hypothetical protein
MRASWWLGVVTCSLTLLACVSARPLRREAPRGARTSAVVARGGTASRASVDTGVVARSSPEPATQTQARARPLPLYPSEGMVGVGLMNAPGLLACGATERVRTIEAGAYYHGDGRAYSITLEEIGAATRTEILPGTPLGDCVRAALRGVRVEPFSRPRWAIHVRLAVGELGREQPTVRAVNRALSSAAPAVRACHGGGQPFVVARVRFRSDGSVSRVDFPQASPNADKACIRDAIRGVNVPPFRARTYVATFPYPVAR